ncbi:MAG TPA: hypothetical protein VFI81_12780, partial [Rhodanobacteraceae bacterium]|nr:hypothetical protein [Rhodanobacteraceae bacterium]
MDQNERIEQLEARVEFLRVMVRELIARFPAHPVQDGPMHGAIKQFNQQAQKLDDPQKSARAEAYRW